jgi:thiol-disulfide isomerase/thioredoxin
MIKKTLGICLLAMSVAFSSSAQYENAKIKVGQDAPELAYPSPEGKIISLQEVNKGLYILLDFWASWCGPCRMSNPGLVKMYNKYKDKKFKKAPKGFTVFSVSLDRKEEAWKKAIAADHLSWPYHISDLKSWQSEAAAAYGIQYIPQTFLIGPDGKIIGKYNSAEAAASELEKFLK